MKTTVPIRHLGGSVCCVSWYCVLLNGLGSRTNMNVVYKADRVAKLREGAEVEYLRKVAAVKGESLLGLSDYRYCRSTLGH